MPQEDISPALVVGPAWLGDMVMAQPLLALLRREEPALQIDVLAPPWTLPLLQFMPEVRRAVLLPIGHKRLNIGLRRQLGRKLRREGYGRAIVLPNSLKSALVPYFARIPRRIGWRGEHRYLLLNDLRRLDESLYPSMPQRFAALCMPRAAPPPQVPSPRLRAEPAAAAAAAVRLGLEDSSPALALCPGAEYGSAKRWPPRHFAEVAREWLARGGQVWLLGGDRERDIAQTVREYLPPSVREGCHNLTGETSLEETVLLLSLSQGAVSNDSGLMHIAAALGRPLAAVYGSTSPTLTPPGGQGQAKALFLDLPCAPCFQRECPLGHKNCLHQLLPERVLEAMSPWLPTGSDS